ncbi:hypothetical protein LJB84_00475 [Bacteroidales bacterium OttesenSCG-928-J19]|nr:hypothetical protein [Bacteroidales bacterium OttesenSCG-928-J19]
MEFLIIALAAVLLYVLGYKTSTLVIVFFFITNGFDLVPEEFMDTGIGFSKGVDFALIILVLLLLVGLLTKKNYLKIDTFAWYLILFYCFLVVCALNSKFSVGLSWFEMGRAGRFALLFPYYFVFRSMSKEQLTSALHICFYITLFTSCIYLLQLPLDKELLNESETSFTDVLGYRVKRYYNQPALISFMVFMALYNNPIKGGKRHFATLILLAAYVFAFHRSWIGFFLIALCFGYVINLPRVSRIKVLSIIGILAIVLILFTGHQVTNSRSFQDISKVMKGEVIDTEFDVTDLGDATFTFRIAHLAERMLYISENPKTQLIGAGLIPEGSKAANQQFDFKVGLLEELTSEVIQTDTADISYSNLFLRFGYLGTICYLLIFFYLTYYFYTKRGENKYAFVALLFLVLSYGVSFFSANLLNPVNYLVLILAYCIVRGDNQLGINTESGIINNKR